MIIDCISDLHGYYPELEGGDLLIVAGDLTQTDAGYQYLEFLEWLKDQNYKKKIVIAGNHDTLLQGGRWKIVTPYEYVGDSSIEYLCDSATTFNKFKIWGSPWTLSFPGINPRCAAFTGTEEELEAKFSLIPDDVDILITHGPPYGMLDLVEQLSVKENNDHKFKGSHSLRKHSLRVKPILHVWGHIHECGGTALRLGASVIANCSHVNENYEPVNKPIRIEI